MPTPPLLNPPTPPARLRVYRMLLDFLSAMRTATAVSADEAVEWAFLEQEFTNRTQNPENEKAA